MRVILARQSKHIQVWTADEKAKVRQMFEDGYSDSEIGKALGRTEKSVELQRHYLGLRKKISRGQKFEINDAMAEYYPRWYKEHLKEQWKRQFSKS
jgi:IS30 family transposase